MWRCLNGKSKRFFVQLTKLLAKRIKPFLVTRRCGGRFCRLSHCYVSAEGGGALLPSVMLWGGCRKAEPCRRHCPAPPFFPRHRRASVQRRAGLGEGRQPIRGKELGAWWQPIGEGGSGVPCGAIANRECGAEVDADRQPIERGVGRAGGGVDSQWGRLGRGWW